MGILDKAKEKASRLAEQAKDKIDDVKEKRKVDELLDELGRITYRQRTERGEASDETEIVRLVGELKTLEAEGTEVLAPASAPVEAEDTEALAPASAPVEAEDTEALAPASAPVEAEDTEALAPASAPVEAEDTEALAPASAPVEAETSPPPQPADSAAFPEPE